jgi:hypothetical protein
MRVHRNESALGLYFYFALLFALNAPAASAEDGSAHSLRPAMIFYFDQPASARAWPAIVDALRREAAGGGYSLPADIEILQASDLRPGSEFSNLIVVHLEGRCDVAEQAYRPLSRGPLGWVLRVEGEIQPFVYVHCDRLAQLLNPKLLGMNDAQRSAAMAIAIARITVHEWLHITLQSTAHTAHGIRRAQLSADELVNPSSGSPGS